MTCARCSSSTAPAQSCVFRHGAVRFPRESYPSQVADAETKIPVGPAPARRIHDTTPDRLPPVQTMGTPRLEGIFDPPAHTPPADVHRAETSCRGAVCPAALSRRWISRGQPGTPERVAPRGHVVRCCSTRLSATAGPTMPSSGVGGVPLQEAVRAQTIGWKVVNVRVSPVWVLGSSLG